MPETYSFLIVFSREKDFLPPGFINLPPAHNQPYIAGFCRAEPHWIVAAKSILPGLFAQFVQFAACFPSPQMLKEGKGWVY
jgi:hypothetical protein